MNSAYIEHTAIYVSNLEWYLDFFETTLNFTERMRKEEVNQPKQVWLYGGIQLIQVTENQVAGKLGHLGIMTEDQAATIKKIQAYPVKQLPQGSNWFELPDGLWIEILQANPGAVKEALKVVPWQ